jgi:hypothetical protein
MTYVTDYAAAITAVDAALASVQAALDPTDANAPYQNALARAQRVLIDAKIGLTHPGGWAPHYRCYPDVLTKLESL